MRILVTGAAGYSGSALVKALAAHEVLATDQSPPAGILATRDLLEACRLAGHRGYAFVRAMEIPDYGPQRTVPLTGIPVSAADMWNAVKGRASGKVRFEPDAAIQAIMDLVPKATRSERAARPGFSHSSSIEEIVREYEEASVAHHG